MTRAVVEQDAHETRARRDEVEFSVAVHVGAGDAGDAAGIRERLRREVARAVAEEQDELPGVRGRFDDTKVGEAVAVQIAQRRDDRIGDGLPRGNIDRGRDAAIAVAEQNGNVVREYRGRRE